MEIINLSRLNESPINGDQIKIIHDNGATEIRYYWDPVSEAAAPILKNILTPLEFLNRFTNTEAKDIIRQSKSNEDIELWWLKYNKAQDMDLDDPQTIEGVQTLEAIGLLEPGRAAEILTKYPL